ncbi:YolD-like family protein [Priestia megaterium]|uniref:YolD-like family protein n=1 Tax=Priestia megaterium TaxID=1404 RepID=UPI00272FCBD4|nr:YolD-like family protein [Priestia megaterium]MDP1442183.1 YolD-like family protein [Priestia megaterium]MDP1471227.1 YolD-like family protein [Priestia megaterium]
MQTRGMKKWRPFATMPEQYLGLQEVINKQLEVPQPLLTEEQMEQINFTLIEALHTNKQVYLTYYKKGQCVTEKGFIQCVDSLGNLFVFIDEVFELKNKMKLSELIGVRFT